MVWNEQQCTYAMCDGIFLSCRNHPHIRLIAGQRENPRPETEGHTRRRETRRLDLWQTGVHTASKRIEPSGIAPMPSLRRVERRCFCAIMFTISRRALEFIVR